MIQGKNSKNDNNNKRDFTEKLFVGYGYSWFHLGRCLMFVFINTFQLTSDKVDNIGNYQI